MSGRQGGTGATGDGSPVQIWDCYGVAQTNQKWYLSEYTVDGRTIYKLNAVHSGKCLDVTGGTGAINNGTQVQQWDCLGDAQTNQRWYLTAPLHTTVSACPPGQAGTAAYLARRIIRQSFVLTVPGGGA